MGFDFGKAVSVMRALKAVYEHRDNEASAIINAILGNQPSLATLLEDLGQSIIHDLDNIYAALQQNNLVKEWSGIANSLNYAHELLKTYHADLGTVSLDKNGNFNGLITVDAGTKQIAYSDWCLGCVDSNGTVRPSALKQLDELINSAVISKLDPATSSLSGIFSTATPGGSSSSQGVDAIATWSSMVLLAKENGNVTNLSGSFKDETQYESMLRLMDYTFSLVAMTLYLHDTALQLLITSTGSNSNHYSLLNGITENFGNSSESSLVWGTFANELTELATGSADQLAANNQAAYTVDPTTRVDYNQVTCHIADYPNGSAVPVYNQYAWGFCSNTVSLANTHPNCFFGSLGFTNINPYGSPNCGSYLYLAVQGTVVSAGANMELTTQGVFPSVADYNNPEFWNGTTYTPAIDNIGTFEGTYVKPPVHSNPNHISVITGFQLTLINDNSGAFNLALALQFGVLDVTDPSQPVVTIPDAGYYAPSYTKALAIQDYVCVNQSGNYDNAAMKIRPAILTNASICRLSNGINGINVQAAPGIYAADFLQPASLQSPLQSKYVNPPVSVS